MSLRVQFLICFDLLGYLRWVFFCIIIIIYNYFILFFFCLFRHMSIHKITFSKSGSPDRIEIPGRYIYFQNFDVPIGDFRYN